METMPVFVKIAEPDSVHELIESLREKVGVARSTLDKLKQLSDLEATKVHEWKTNFKDINKKLGIVHHELHEPQGL